jgi:hypothetical protein
MPIGPTGVSASRYSTGKDQGRIHVEYRDARGETHLAKVLGPATVPDTPEVPVVTPQGVAGTTTYRYRISAVDADGFESAAGASGQTTTGNAALSGANFNRVTWDAVPGAAAYRVYGRSGAEGALLLMSEVTETTYDDTGADSPAGALPSGTVAANTLKLEVQGKIRNGVALASDWKTTDAYINRLSNI